MASDSDVLIEPILERIHKIERELKAQDTLIDGIIIWMHQADKWMEKIQELIGK